MRSAGKAARVSNEKQTPLGSEAELRRWLADRAALIEAGKADERAGRVVDFAEVEAWMDSWDTDHELPTPRSKG